MLLFAGAGTRAQTASAQDAAITAEVPQPRPGLEESAAEAAPLDRPRF